MKKIGMIAAMIFLAILIIGFYGCATTADQISKEEAKIASPVKEELKVQNEEATLSIEGEIDSLKTINESYQKRGEIALTIISLKDGNGVIAKGIYPGLKEGKKVKLYLKPSDTIYKGSPTYEIYKIEGLP